MKTGAVIVAAGLSSRMKSFKPMLALGGSTIIRTAITTIQSTGISEIVVVTGRDADLLSRHLHVMDVTCLFNPDYAQCDMFSSACLGLEYIRTRCDRTFFLPADIPLFSPQSLITLSGSMDCSDSKIVIPVHEGRKGHPILIDCSIIPALTDYQGEDGLKGAIRGFSGKTALVVTDDIGITLDADKPEQYEQLSEYARSETAKLPLCPTIQTGIQRRQLFFDMELCRLLRTVEHCQSLNKACELMDMAYTKGWRNIKIAEHQLGFLLLDSHTGGNCGGGSTLTSQCQKFLNDYEAYCALVEQYAAEHFERFFAACQNPESL
jgi:molybdate transport repressor ModE-like protein